MGGVGNLQSDAHGCCHPIKVTANTAGHGFGRGVLHPELPQRFGQFAGIDIHLMNPVGTEVDTSTGNNRR